MKNTGMEWTDYTPCMDQQVTAPAASSAASVCGNRSVAAPCVLPRTCNPPSAQITNANAPADSVDYVPTRDLSVPVGSVSSAQNLQVHVF